jgi:1-acyl-sn-glycerol-3-phosphate acyltransferase
MSLNRYIQLRRGSRESVVQMLRACRETLAAGSSILVFPEGTRSETGEMRAFKSGAFEIAISARRPILPIAVRGTAAALPKRGFVLRGRHPIRVRVLDELPCDSFEGVSAEVLAARVRELIAAELDPPRA